MPLLKFLGYASFSPYEHFLTIILRWNRLLAHLEMSQVRFCNHYEELSVEVEYCLVNKKCSFCVSPNNFSNFISDYTLSKNCFLFFNMLMYTKIEGNFKK